MNVEEFLIDKYVRPYYTKPDSILENDGRIIKEWRQSVSFEEDVAILLSDTGWRNRVVASTIIGGLKLERFEEQIFSQASELNELYAAKSYAFALVRLRTTKSIEHLRILARANAISEYSDNLQSYYKAGLVLVDRGVKPQSQISNHVDYLVERIEKWDSFNR